MKAITVEPRKPETARLEDIAEPDARGGSVLVEAIAVGVCGTDVEIVEGKYGWAPQGKTRLVLGHESLGRVVDPGPNSALKEGDLVAGIVRRPDPVPCPNCAVGEWDMCRNGQYTERGIKEIDGFMSERWRIEPEYVVKIDPSLGKQLGLDVHVLDRVDSGAKPEIVRALGATYHAGSVSSIGFQPDVVIECTGVGQVIIDSIQAVAPGGVVCLTGVGSGGHTSSLPAADTASNIVLRNNVVVGTVNANKRHWYKAAQLLSRTDHAWLSRIVTRREPAAEFKRALARQPDDIKVIVQFAEA